MLSFIKIALVKVSAHSSETLRQACLLVVLSKGGIWLIRLSQEQCLNRFIFTKSVSQNHIAEKVFRNSHRVFIQLIDYEGGDLRVASREKLHNRIKSSGHLAFWSLPLSDTPTLLGLTALPHFISSNCFTVPLAQYPSFV